MTNRYNTELLLVKAQAISLNRKTSENVFCGFYYQQCDKHYIFFNGNSIEIDCNTICRNTGLKVYGEYLFEGDLIEVSCGAMEMVCLSEDNDHWCTLMFIGSIPILLNAKTAINNIKRIMGNYRLSDTDKQLFEAYSATYKKLFLDRTLTIDDALDRPYKAPILTLECFYAESEQINLKTS